MIRSNIHKHSNYRKHCENACCSYKILKAKKVLISESKIRAEEYLNSVVNHCLNVYEYLRCEYVVWKNVNTSACEETKCCKKNNS